MGARLTDSELATRIRAANQRRAARLVERQKAAGRVAMTIWVNATTKERIEAARHGSALNETAERLLLAGLAATTTPADTTSPAATATTTTRDALMMEVGKLLNEGLTGAEVARRLNASGQRTASGSAFTGQNVLRDYRAWARKNGVVSDNHTTSGA